MKLPSSFYFDQHLYHNENNTNNFQTRVVKVLANIWPILLLTMLSSMRRHEVSVDASHPSILTSDLNISVSHTEQQREANDDHSLSLLGWTITLPSASVLIAKKKNKIPKHPILSSGMTLLAGNKVHPVIVRAPNTKGLSTMPTKWENIKKWLYLNIQINVKITHRESRLTTRTNWLRGWRQMLIN